MVQLKTLMPIMCFFLLTAPLEICLAQNPAPVEPMEAKQATAIKKEEKIIEKAPVVQSKSGILFDRSKLTREEQSFLAEKDAIMSSGMDKQEKEKKIAALKEKMLGEKSR